MSYRVEFKTEINDLDLFKTVCGWNNVEFNATSKEITERGNYLGKLTKKDKDGDSYVFVTDSDYTGSSRLRGDYTNVNNIMRDYSEQICYRAINNVGTLLNRSVTDRGIVLRVAVNG